MKLFHCKTWLLCSSLWLGKCYRGEPELCQFSDMFKRTLIQIVWNLVARPPDVVTSCNYAAPLATWWTSHTGKLPHNNHKYHIWFVDCLSRLSHGKTWLQLYAFVVPNSFQPLFCSILLSVSIVHDKWCPPRNRLPVHDPRWAKRLLDCLGWSFAVDISSST